MQSQTFATRTRTQAPSQIMRGVAAPCAGSPAKGLREGRVHRALRWSDTRFGGWDYGNPWGGGPA